LSSIQIGAQLVHEDTQMRKQITKRVVDALQPNASVADSEVRGFVARRLPTGTVSYGLRYTDKLTRKRRWLPLGLHGRLTPDEARRLARKAAGLVADGKDPLKLRQSSIAEALQTASEKTINDLLDSFLTDYVDQKKLRTGREIRSALERLVRPTIGKKSVRQITRRDIVEMCDAVANSKSDRQADLVLAYVRKAFNWYSSRSDEDFISPISPGMSRLKPRESMRQRVLSDDEIRDVWAALNHVHPAYAAVLRGLLYSGARLTEIGSLAYNEITSEAIIIPGERVKSGAAHAIPLTPALRNVIDSRRENEKPKKDARYVFWGRKNGKKPFQGWSSQKEKLDAAIQKIRLKRRAEPMPPWRHHDLRRTARTLMSRAGIQSDIAERILGHSIPGIRKVYDIYDYFREKRDALVLYQEFLDRIIFHELSSRQD
jgi:intergrase/recombinase